MFPFSVSRHMASKCVHSAVWVFEGSAYEAVTFDSEKINVFAAQVNACEPHWHSASELIYVLSGSFTVTVNQESRTLRAGGMLYIHSDQIHALVALTANSRLITVQFSPDLFEAIYHIAPFSYCVEDKKAYQEADHTIKSTLIMLLTQNIQDKTVTPFYKMALIYQLLAELECAGQALAESKQVSVREKDEKLIKQSIEFINANCSHPVSLSAIAEQAGVSYSYFSKLFKKISGYNFKTYLDIVRINKAKFLLKNTQIPITEISHRCGFTEHKHLISTFKRLCFMTPTEFRKQRLTDIQAHACENAMISFHCLALTPALLQGMKSL